MVMKKYFDRLQRGTHIRTFERNLMQIIKEYEGEVGKYIDMAINFLSLTSVRMGGIVLNSKIFSKPLDVYSDSLGNDTKAAIASNNFFRATDNQELFANSSFR